MPNGGHGSGGAYRRGERCMIQFWATITAPQATIIAGILTLAAAIVGVLLGAWLFGNRVGDLKGALEVSDRLLNDHKSAVESGLVNLEAQFNDFMATTRESLGQLRGVVGDIESNAASPQEDESQARSSEDLREDWSAIRDDLERQAVEPTIKGQTRAKYARIDRRNYMDLVNALVSDGHLHGDVDRFREAIALWYKFRTGKRMPSPDDNKKMKQLRAMLVMTA